jgi:hypothetical protein
MIAASLDPVGAKSRIASHGTDLDGEPQRASSDSIGFASPVERSAGSSKEGRPFSSPARPPLR